MPSKSALLRESEQQWREEEEWSWRFYQGGDGVDWDAPDRNDKATADAAMLVYLARRGVEASLGHFLESRPKLDVDEQDVDWDIALHEAGRHGHLGCAKMLLSRGASLKILGRYGQGALDCACSWDSDVEVEVSAAMVRLFAEGGADLEASDMLGRTPFLAACCRLNLGAAAALMELGADTAAVDGKGLDGWDLASGQRRCWSTASGKNEEQATRRKNFLGWLRSAWERMALAEGVQALPSERGKPRARSI